MTDQTKIELPTEPPPAAHFHGCPSERSEGYEQRRPDGSRVWTQHCLDCGATAYLDLTKEENHAAR